MFLLLGSPRIRKILFSLLFQPLTLAQLCNDHKQKKQDVRVPKL